MCTEILPCVVHEKYRANYIPTEHHHDSGVLDLEDFRLIAQYWYLIDVIMKMINELSLGL